MQRPQIKIEKENLRPIPQDLENNNHLISRGSGRPLKSTIPTEVDPDRETAGAVF
jgi:hypothetical protein